MRILFLGDIHYPREAAILFDLLRLIENKKPDIIAICGDILNHADIFLLDKLLRKIHRRTKTRIIAVMGNHDFWIIRRKTISSWDLIQSYEKAMKKHDDVLLWEEPFVEEGIAIVGVPGWYDFSFAPFSLGFTRIDFLRGTYGGFIWNDVRYAKFAEEPEEITKIHTQKLEKQISKIGNNQIIVILHFIPMKDFLIYNGNPNHDFWNAYSGSELLGETILKHNQKIRYVFFGHHSYKKLKTKSIIREDITLYSVDISDGVDASMLLEI
ncbi:MAG: metallophosphoesterase [Candidatus Njordarchaeota archaeon]